MTPHSISSWFIALAMAGLPLAGCPEDEPAVPEGDTIAADGDDTADCDSGAACDTAAAADTAVPEDIRPQPMDCDPSEPPAQGCRCKPGIDDDLCCLGGGLGMACDDWNHTWGYAPDACGCRVGSADCAGAQQAPACPW